MKLDLTPAKDTSESIARIAPTMNSAPCSCDGDSGPKLPGSSRMHVEKGGQNLQTVKEYGDVELYVDWCIEQGADSGVYLKNAPQIQMWSSPLGSGGLFNNKAGARNPLVVAEPPRS